MRQGLTLLTVTFYHLPLPGKPRKKTAKKGGVWWQNDGTKNEMET
ncbi:unnamed protein product [marine sediment metagenome]|uniref:Uncharacterized protein n=1 Tax=marine sediment metagenome TaxID=412755 RepID=X1VFW5_9ZZZZ